MRRPRYLSGYGLVEVPLERCVERLLGGEVHGRPVGEPAEVDGVDEPLHSTRGQAIAYLNALTHPEMRRVLFAVNDRWTAVVNNRRDGSDFENDQHLFAAICRARTCRVVDRPGRIDTVGAYKVRQEYPARIFVLADADGRTVRSVTCALDGDRWVFETSGTPLAAEADFPYTARRKTRPLHVRAPSAAGRLDRSGTAGRRRVRECGALRPHSDTETRSSGRRVLHPGRS